MAQLSGLARIGRDAELRFTQGGDPVASLSLAFSYGKKGDDGNRPTQWVDGSLWGKRAESIAPYLLKGTLVYVVLDDAHIETYPAKDGTQGSKLSGRVSVIEFASKPAQPAQQQRPAQSPTRQSMAQQAPAGGFADMDDDVPFNRLGAGRAWAVI